MVLCFCCACGSGSKLSVSLVVKTHKNQYWCIRAHLSCCSGAYQTSSVNIGFWQEKRRCTEKKPLVCSLVVKTLKINNCVWEQSSTVLVERSGNQFTTQRFLAEKRQRMLTKTQHCKKILFRIFTYIFIAFCFYGACGSWS